MKKLTNKGHLPQPLYEAICKVNEKYDPGDSDITVTQLIDSPRIRLLRKKHEDEIEEDVSQMIWRFFGSVSHEVIANMGDFNKLVEERLNINVLGWKVGGQLDLLENDVLSDYKITSKYSVKNGVKPEYEKQLNCLHYLLIKNGQDVKKLQMVVILRDAGRTDEKVVVLPVRMWGLVKIEEYIEFQVERHQEIEHMFNILAALPFCSDEERWYVPPKFALMKKGNKRAVKLYDSITEATTKASLLNSGDIKKHYVEERKGENKRCEGYCEVNKWCDWWQKELLK